MCAYFFCLQLFAADNASLRKNFLYAEEALQKGDLDTYYKLKPGLTEYPLYPYLQYAEITRMMRQGLPSDTIEKFIDTYPGSALAIRLQANWLNTLAKQQQWQLYQQFYKPSNDVALQCYNVWADYKITQKQNVLAQATPLWVQGRSQPDACNSLFATWQKSTYFNNEQAWKRAQLAMDANQAKLVTYLKRFLNAEQLTFVDTWFKMYDLKLSIRKDTELALVNWEKIKDKYPFTAHEIGEVNYAFALELATDHDERAISWLNAVPKAQMDAPIYEWRVRYALRQQDWDQVLAYINDMPKDLQQQPNWRYWQGRALLALNQSKEAQPILLTLSSERHYHGMLASDLIKKPYSLNNSVYKVDAKTKTFVENDPGIQRAQELFVLKRLGDARREWNTSTATFNEEQLQAAAQLARSMDWYDRGILTATLAQNRNDLNVRFPLAYENSIKTAANKNKIDPAWAFAITRQESAFLPDAQSSANAMGLMQLLPSTAQLVAKQTGQTYSKNNLIIPEKNIALGTVYLRDMLAKFNQNKQLASAAYNAGASRVYRWLPDDKLPTDVWVETIPFKETRGYVQNVSSYWVIYNDHLGIDDRRLNHHDSYISNL